MMPGPDKSARRILAFTISSDMMPAVSARPFCADLFDRQVEFAHVLLLHRVPNTFVDVWWASGRSVTVGRAKAVALLTRRRVGGSLFDELGCFLRMRHVGHMAGIHFDRGGMGALRHHALLIWIDRPICGGHHVPSGLGLPGGRRDLVGERVGG